MIILITYYGIALLIVGSAGYQLARFLYGRYGLAIAFGAGLLTVTAMVLLYPIPIHGGFMVLGEVVLGELQDRIDAVEQQQEQQHDVAFDQQLADRFGATFQAPVSLNATNWQALNLASGNIAYLDQRSGLVWSPPLPWQPRAHPPELSDAMAFCQAQAPAGHWALPSEAELAQFWLSDGQQLLPGNGMSSLSFIHDETTRVDITTRYQGRVPGYALRCVGRTDAAPLKGYSKADLSLETWNRFQLSKTQIFNDRAQ